MRNSRDPVSKSHVHVYMQLCMLSYCNLLQLSLDWHIRAGAHKLRTADLCSAVYQLQCGKKQVFTLYILLVGYCYFNLYVYVGESAFRTPSIHPRQHHTADTKHNNGKNKKQLSLRRATYHWLIARRAICVLVSVWVRSMCASVHLNVHNKGPLNRGTVISFPLLSRENPLYRI